MLPSVLLSARPRLRKFPVRVPGSNPFLILARDGVKFLTTRILRAGGRLPFYSREILLQRESTRRSGNAAAAAPRLREEKTFHGPSLVGLIERVPESTPFSPLESRGGKSPVPRANFGKHRR